MKCHSFVLSASLFIGTIHVDASPYLRKLAPQDCSKVWCFADPCLACAEGDQCIVGSPDCCQGKCVSTDKGGKKAKTETVVVLCGTNSCNTGEYCCNESCGHCAPIGGFYTQEACDRDTSLLPWMLQENVVTYQALSYCSALKSAVVTSIFGRSIRFRI